MLRRKLLISARSYTNKVWHYLAYTDLLVARVEDNTSQWAVYLLRDYTHTAEEAT
jgi:hypothetical protein